MNLLSALLPIIITIAALTLLIRVPFIRRFCIAAVAIIPAGLLAFLSMLAIPLWRPAQWIVQRLPFLDALPKRVANYIEAKAQKDSNPLSSGNKQIVANTIWPKTKYPWLYKSVFGDLERTLWEDGRLPGGVSMTWLADRYFTEELIEKAFRAGLTAWLILILVPAIWFLAQLLFMFIDPFLGMSLSLIHI